jgi:hypothetical protein
VEVRCCDCHEKQQRGELDHNRKNIDGRAFTRASRTDSISGKTRTANEMRLGARGLPSNDSSAISPGAAPMPSLPAVSFFRRERGDGQPLSGRPNPRAPATSAAFKIKKLTGLEGGPPLPNPGSKAAYWARLAEAGAEATSIAESVTAARAIA